MAPNDIVVTPDVDDASQFEAVFAETPEAGRDGEDKGGSKQPHDKQGRFTSPTKVEDSGDGGDQRQEERVVHTVPLSEHLSTRERAQAAERERDDLRRRLEAFDREKAEAAKPKRERPDLITDPDAAYGYIEEQINGRGQSVEQMLQSRILDMTFADQDEADPEKFGKAFAALRQANADGDPVVARIKNAPNPGKALMRWHSQNEALREVGGDIGQYKEKLWGEFIKDPERRKQFAETMEAEARGGAGNGKDRSTVISMPSLTRATGSGGNQLPAGLGDTDGERFTNVFVRKR
jgi:hypothetical protein